MKKRAFENIVGKGENAGNQHLPCFLPYQREIIILSLANAFNFGKSKILLFRKGLKYVL